MVAYKSASTYVFTIFFNSDILKTINFNSKITYGSQNSIQSICQLGEKGL